MKKIKKNLKWITLMIVMIIMIGGFLIKYSLSANKVEEISIKELELKENELEGNNSDNKEEEGEISVLSQNIYVDIKGAVQNPGVYEITEDKKVIDVVQLAGGLTEEADTSMINLAKKVTNEMVIIIYTVDEVKKTGQTDTVVKIIEKECVCPQINNDACLKQEDNQTDVSIDKNENSDAKININNATIEELLALSGVGESKAEAIIKYREENGKFEKIEDIMEVAGIGETLYEKIKDSITV